MSVTIKLHITAIASAHLHNTFKKTSFATKFQSKPIYHTNSLAPLVFSQEKMTSLPSSSKGSVIIKSSLIEPDGGSLVDLVVPENQRVAKISEAGSLPKVKLTKIDLEWVHVISEGWASPLKGFMRENEYLQSLHFNSFRMKDGSVVNMSLPIVLAIDDEAKEKIGTSSDVALVGPDGNLVAILRRLALLDWISFLNTFKIYLVYVAFSLYCSR